MILSVRQSWNSANRTVAYTYDALADPANHTSRYQYVFHCRGICLHLGVALLECVEGKEEK